MVFVLLVHGCTLGDDPLPPPVMMDDGGVEDAGLDASWLDLGIDSGEVADLGVDSGPLDLGMDAGESRDLGRDAFEAVRCLLTASVLDDGGYWTTPVATGPVVDCGAGMSCTHVLDWWTSFEGVAMTQYSCEPTVDSGVALDLGGGADAAPYDDGFDAGGSGACYRSDWPVGPRPCGAGGCCTNHNTIVVGPYGLPGTIVDIYFCESCRDAEGPRLDAGVDSAI